MAAIRVLEVFHGMDCGGAENMIMNLYREMNRDVVQLDFLVHTDNKCFFDDEIISLGGNIYRVPYYNGVNYFVYKNALNKFFSSHPEIKIVHGHLGSCSNIYLHIAKKYGCYAIAHSHNTKPELSIKSLIYRLNTYQTRRIADCFFGCSEAAGRYRFGNRIVDKSGHYYNLNNAICVDDFVYNEVVRHTIREEYHLNGSIVLGHVGRFNYQKNHSFLIDVFDTFVGDGELRETIQNKVESLGLTESVIFAGLKDNVNELLQGMDCFVFPSHYEGLPVTLIEAQASGLPCVVSDSISRESSITNLVRFAPLEQSVDYWTQNIIDSINSTVRTNTRSAIIDSGYDIHSTAKWLEEFYSSL